MNTASDSLALKLPVVPGQEAALTAALTTITPANTHASPDYAIQAVVNSSAWGFAAEAEAISFIFVVKNLQERVAQLEARLESMNAIASN